MTVMKSGWLAFGLLVRGLWGGLNVRADSRVARGEELKMIYSHQGEEDGVEHHRALHDGSSM